MPDAWGQPDIPGSWEFRAKEIEVMELTAGAISPGYVVNQPNQFRFRVHLENKGPLSNACHGLGAGGAAQMLIRCERQEDNTVVTLPDAGTYAPPGTGGAEHFPSDFTWDSDVFVSGATGSGAQLEPGTYFVTVIINFTAPMTIVSQAAAFCTTLMRVI